MGFPDPNANFNHYLIGVVKRRDLHFTLGRLQVNHVLDLISKQTQNLHISWVFVSDSSMSVSFPQSLQFYTIATWAANNGIVKKKSQDRRRSCAI